MRILRHGKLSEAERGAAIAIGNFDGVHQGHRAVIAAAGRVAAAAGSPHAVLTFEPHPRHLFHPEEPPFRLTPFRGKARLIAGLGVDLLLALRFDKRFAAQSAEAFARDLLVGALGAHHVVVGEDFVFGQGRRGTAAQLEALGQAQGFGVTIVGAVAAANGGRCSSTSIREHLRAGRPGEAAALLGRSWEIEGRVRRGEARGRLIGFPTANLALGDYLRPAAGVYAIRAALAEDGRTVWHDGVANLGLRPTFGGQDLRLEAHLFDFAGNLYGKHLRVALVEHLRPERKFPGIDALKTQIAADAEAARAILAPAP